MKYAGDITFDETEEVVLKGGGTLSVYCYGIPEKVGEERILEDKKYSYETLFPDLGRYKVDLQVKGLEMFGTLPAYGYLEKKRGVYTYGSIKKESSSVGFYDNVTGYSQIVMPGPPQIRKLGPRKVKVPGDGTDTLYIKFINANYLSNGLYDGSWECTIRSTDGSFLECVNGGLGFIGVRAMRIGYRDGDKLEFITYGIGGESYYVGTLITKSGHRLFGTRDFNDYNRFVDQPTFLRSMDVVKQFMKYREEKPRYKVEYISHSKYFGWPGKNSMNLEDDIKALLKKYPHKDSIAILSIYENESHLGEKDVHHFDPYLIVDDFGDIRSSCDPSYNAFNVAEYVHGELKSIDKIYNELYAKALEIRRDMDKEYEDAAKAVKSQLKKKYNANLVDECFHMRFKGASTDLVYDFIEQMKPVVTNQILKVWKSQPSFSAIRTYGSGIECHVVKKGPLKIVLIVRNGKVIDQINGID